MTDYYFSSTDYNALAGMLTTINGEFFRVAYANILGPVKGKNATPEHVTEEGETVPAQPAIGDPNAYYVCIRSNDDITPPEGVNVTDAETALALLGTWA